VTLLSPHPASRHRLAGVDVDPAAVRGAFGGFPSGVAALCATVDGKPVGLVASSFSVGVSYSPPMVMFSVQNSSTTWPELARAARIGVSILGREQADTCLQLASRDRDARFSGVETTVSEGGALFLDAATMWLECEVVSTTPAGDHQVVVLQVHGLSVDDGGDPLVYRQRAFHGLRPIS
jgi:flavin reductase (DIM6/NTAB) family NADH-FMN oxidoreductase RutF